MVPFALLPSMGGYELAVIGFVALLIFGNRLPSVMRSLGKSVTEFKKGMNSIEDEGEGEAPAGAAAQPKPDATPRDA